MPSFTSDDFSSSLLGSNWFFAGPGGGYQLSSDSTDAFVELVVPQGSYDPWNQNNAVRLMQAATDEDFGIEVRFLSEPTQRYQMQGLLFEQDASNWIRFDTYSDGTQLHAFAAVTLNGSSSVRFDVVIPTGGASYLRADRTGDTWTFEYSADGITWITAGSFTQTLSVTSVGPFAGSTGPAYTAQVDYVFNSAAPIANEDAGVGQRPVAQDDTATASLNTALVINVAADLLANDSDPNGDPLSLSGFTQPANGTLVDNLDGTLTYTPNAGYTGADSFTYTVTDGSYTDTATVNLTVTDNSPVALDDTAAASLNTALVINVAADLLANDSDPNGDPLSLSGFTQPTNGTLVDNLDGTLTYTPNTGYTGADSFTYTVTDGSYTDTATVSLTVTDPTAVPGDIASDDFSGDSLDSVWSLQGPGGTYQLSSDSTDAFVELVVPQGSYDPWNQNNAVRLMQAATDEDFGIEVRFLSEPTQQYQMQGLLFEQDASNWIRFDTYSDGTQLHVFSAVTLNGSSSVRFDVVIPTGGASYLRADRAGDTWTFAYSADGATWITAGSFTQALSVTSVGPFAGSTGPAYTGQVDYVFNSAAPIANEDASIGQRPVAQDDTAATDIDTALVLNVAADLLANDSDPNGDPLSLSGFTQPTNGTLVDNLDGTLTYTPNAGYTGADSFTYTVTDGSYTDTATVNLTVNATAPVAVDDTATASLNTALVINVAADLLANDSDPNGDPLSLSGFTQPTNGTLVDNGNGTLTYTPNAGYTGADSFTYTITDGASTDTATVNLTIVDTAPVAQDDAAQAFLNTALVINVAADLLANDSDPNGDPLSLSGFTQPANGTLVDNLDGTLTYTPNAGYTGADSFTYTITDGTSTDTATVSLTVSDPSAVPGDIISDDFSSASLDDIWSLQGPAGSYQVSIAGSESFLELIVPQGSYDPWHQNNAVRMMQAATDEDFGVEVRFLSEPTQRYQMQGLLFEQDASNWIRFDTYSDGAQLHAFSAVTLNGSSTPMFDVVIPTGGASYLRADRAGDTWTFAYSADGVTWTTAGSFTRALSVTAVGPFAGSTGPAYTSQVDYIFNSAAPIANEDAFVGQRPVAQNDTAATDANTALVLNVAADLLANDSDPNGDPLSLSGFTQPVNGTLVDNGNGTLTYTPNAGYTGADSFTYTITDGTSTDTATVNLTVNATAPVAVDDTATAALNTALVLNVAADLLVNDSDPNGDPLSLSGFTQPANGTLVDNGDGTLTYTPNADYLGADSFTYTITDGSYTDTATVSLTVEDPYVNKAPHLVSGRSVFSKDVIDTTMDKTHFVVSADFDGDGDVDLAATDFVDGNVAWYQNDGAGGFTKITVDGALAGAYPLLASDLNQDGAVDLLAMGYLADTTVWYENDGTGGFTRRTIDAAIDGPHSILTIDLDRDGDLDVVTANQDANSIVWYENSGTLSFTKNTVDLNALAAKAVAVADLDGDGDTDLIGASFGDDTVAWYENDGFSGFTKRAIDTTVDGAYFVAAADLDGDLDSDIVVASQLDNTVRWYRNDGSGVFVGQGIDTAAAGARAVHVVDIDADGDLDVLSASVNDNTIAWYVNDGAGGFTKTVVDSSALGAYGVSAADVNKDGLLDILSASRDANEIAVNYQTKVHEVGVFEGGTLVIGTGVLQATDPDDGPADLVYTLTSAPSLGDLQLSGVTLGVGGTFTQADVDAGSVTYLHTGTGMAADTFSFSLADGGEDGVNPTLGSFVISPVSTSPIAQDDAVQAFLDTARTLNVAADLLANDSDPNGDPLSLSGFTQPTNGTLVDNGDGTLTYTPSTGYTGTDSFTYTITDGTSTDTATVNLTVTDPSAIPGGLLFDDFNSLNADPTLWSFVNPTGAAVFKLMGAGTGQAYLQIETAPGNSDPWQVNRSARMMQQAINEDFGVEVSFLSVPTQQSQSQGILIEQDANNWIRFDTYSDGAQLHIFSAVTLGGKSTAMFDLTVPTGGASYLRADRTGDTWTFEYSADGTTWTAAGSYTQALTVTSVGPFAGSANGSAGYTAQVDYFANTALSISGEDQGSVPGDTIAPSIQNLATSNEVNGDVTFDFVTDEATTVVVRYGLTPQLELGTTPAQGPAYDHSVSLSGLTLGQDYYYEIVATDASNNTSIDSGTFTAELPIDVWYGDVQKFGNLGESQQWVNILGDLNLPNVSSLAYSLNGGADRPLSIGADGLRLQNPGDFNIDIDFAELDGSTADDIVTIKATLSNGDIVSKDVTIDYVSGQQWSSNYSIDWATVTDIQDVVQVVDGLWTFDENGARPVEPGYDRLLAIGDYTWDNYEVNLSITINDMTTGDPNGRWKPELGFATLWNGHTDDPTPDIQPKAGYLPSSAFFYDLQPGKYTIHPYGDFFNTLDAQPFSLQEGSTYNFTYRVEQTNVFDRTYSLKVWEQGTAEPTGWLIQGTEQFSEPVTGSILLNAHFADVTFGDITVTEITGSDIVQGRGTNDVLMAADTTQANPGLGEIDVFVGGAGADTFVFGDSSGAFYDDGDGTTDGVADYGLIWDFESGIDQIQLAGAIDDYILGEAPPGMTSGTAIYRVNDTGPDEMIGIVSGVSNMSLSSSDFILIGIDPDPPLA